MSKELEVLKHDIARELFLNTADQTYVVARWCYLNRIYLDFYWNATHALEKYLKAALLMNGRSAITDGSGGSFGHDVLRLYEQVDLFASELMPLILSRPERLKMAHWRDETMSEFLKRLSNNGDPNNRYNVFGFGQFPEDLYKLDIAVHAIRRAAQPLDEKHFSTGQRTLGAPSETNMEFSLRHPNYQPALRGSKLEKLTGTKATDQVRNASLKQNLPFAPIDYEHGSMRNSFSGENPVLYLHILSALDRPAGKQDGVIAELSDWAIQNIYFPRDVKMELRDAAQKLRDRSASRSE